MVGKNSGMAGKNSGRVQKFRRMEAETTGNIPVWSKISLRGRENVFRCMETLVLRHLSYRPDFPFGFSISVAVCLTVHFCIVLVFPFNFSLFKLFVSGVFYMVFLLNLCSVHITALNG